MPICTTDYLLANKAFAGSHPHFLIFLLPLMEFHGVLSTHFQGTSSTIILQSHVLWKSLWLVMHSVVQCLYMEQENWKEKYLSLSDSYSRLVRDHVELQGQFEHQSDLLFILLKTGFENATGVQRRFIHSPSILDN